MSEEQAKTPSETIAPAPVVEAPAAAIERTAKPLPAGTQFIWGTGRRKKAVARVRIRPGSGKFIVNEREMENYFVEDRDRADIMEPLRAAHMTKSYDVYVNVNGGGATGQAGAVTLGLSRALVRAMPEVEADLRGLGLLTRDSRSKERKKYGQKGARKRFQFSKR